MAYKTALAIAVIVFLLPAAGFSQTVVDELVAINLSARGGAEAWRAVSSLKLTGWMDIGQETMVPYVLEQKRPRKMRMEYVFDEKTAIQASNGETGWKFRPFLGRSAPEPMTDTELRETRDTADLEGLLFNYKERGHKVELLGQEQVEGKDTFKLKVTLPGGTVRWVYIDANSGLEVKIEATRVLRGKERRVETFYREWKNADGLLIPSRQETRTEGETTLHLFVVQTVTVNPPIDDSRFEMPGARKLAGAR